MGIRSPWFAETALNQRIMAREPLCEGNLSPSSAVKVARLDE